MLKFKVYYAKTPRYRLGSGPLLTAQDLPQTHVLLCEIEAETKDHACWLMQGEVWSPNGEARPLIKLLGLTHTTMSISDVVQDPDGVYWECVNYGWRKLEANGKENEHASR